MKTKDYFLARAEVGCYVDAPPGDGWTVHSWHFDEDGWPFVLWEHDTIDLDTGK